ncbi:MAG: glycosyltransferase family 2 protein [Candidatus Omnitrophica bacterium]|nr:glycosyltransferase family 2 protein [Candidatus Omnitrophota bacterium]
MLAGLCVAVYCLSVVAGDLRFWISHRLEILLALAGIGCWRWSWFILQNARAIVYRYYTFPKIRRSAARALAANGPVPEVTILAVTYREKPWITRAVFSSIFRELSSLEGLIRRPRVVVATGCDEDDATIKVIYAEQCAMPSSLPEAGWPPELVLLREDNGKRPAIAAALREITRGQPLEDGAVVFLDGDTVLQPGLLKKVLPMLRLAPPVAAVTTNEDGWVRGPSWFAEWTSLRFGLRHRTMCSVSLSGKLLCLTGRLSVFRGSVATDPSFLAQIEHDTINNWLWGAFEMLSGDDKSTWYWLSRHGCRMLYVPDAKVTTIEVVQGTGIQRALANIRRWSGNSLRHSWRAIRLGPIRLGLFPWWSLIDQRLAMFTVLFGPTVCLLALFAGRFDVSAGYAMWVILSRIAHSAIAWRHGRRLSVFYIPMVFMSDWATALTKMWVLFHPAKQSWLNRGARTVDSTKASRFYKLQSGLAHYLYAFTCLVVAVLVGLFVGLLPILKEAPLFLASRPKASAPVERALIRPELDRLRFGSIPNAGGNRLRYADADPDRPFAKSLAVWQGPKSAR